MADLACPMCREPWRSEDLPEEMVERGAWALAAYDRDVTGLNPKGEPTNGDYEAARAVLVAALSRTGESSP